MKQCNSRITWKLASVWAVALLTCSASLSAHDSSKHDASVASGSRQTDSAVLQVSADATDAVATLKHFSVALGSGNVNEAVELLDPDVIILESGGAERSREEYLQSHAMADAAFLKDAKVTLSRRTASASGSLAWVASESVISTTAKGTPTELASTETAVLRKTADGWKIIHIHWSSRQQDTAR